MAIGLPHRRLRWLALLPTLFLTGCFTMSAWGFDRVDDDEDGHWEWSAESWEASGLAWWQRVLLVPITLAADCVTAPIQCFFGVLDCHEHERRDESRCRR